MVKHLRQKPKVLAFLDTLEMVNSLVKSDPLFPRCVDVGRSEAAILAINISKAEMAGFLRTISTPAKGCSKSLSVSSKSAASLSGARTTAGVTSSARACLGYCIHHLQHLDIVSPVRVESMD